VSAGAGAERGQTQVAAGLWKGPGGEEAEAGRGA